MGSIRKNLGSRKAEEVARARARHRRKAARRAGKTAAAPVGAPGVGGLVRAAVEKVKGALA
jgi:hypothetical protein